MASNDAGSVSEQPSPTVTADDTVEPPDPEPAVLPLDEVFGLLTNQRRRRVLQYLDDHEERVSLSDLAEQLAAWENDKPIAHLTSAERKRVYVGLYQVHLPKMDAMDVVEFNKSRGIIERGENAHVLEPYLERATSDTAGDGPQWHRYYAALSVASAIALVVSALVQPAVGIPVPGIVAVAVVAAFAVCSVVHFRWARTQRVDDAPPNSA